MTPKSLLFVWDMTRACWLQSFLLHPALQWRLESPDLRVSWGAVCVEGEVLLIAGLQKRGAENALYKRVTWLRLASRRKLEGEKLQAQGLWSLSLESGGRGEEILGISLNKTKQSRGNEKSLEELWTISQTLRKLSNRPQIRHGKGP